MKHGNKSPHSPATRQSWANLRPLPAQRSRLSLDREFTQQEFEQIRLGFIPENMEDKWFVFLEEYTVYVHRSWTGQCIYRLELVGDDAKYKISEAYVNRDKSQYAGSDDPYDEKLLMFLIDYLLLKKRLPLPMPWEMPAGLTTELHHHHVLGAGQRAAAGRVNVTVKGVLKWLWRWLLWLFKR